MQTQLEALIDDFMEFQYAAVVDGYSHQLLLCTTPFINPKPYPINPKPKSLVVLGESVVTPSCLKSYLHTRDALNLIIETLPLSVHVAIYT